MVAHAEAKAMLDGLMGVDRNAPLPPGAAIPGHKQGSSSSSQLLLPSQRRKSCFDPDICPFYCAWGVDVYDLFKNTKSDLGPNPNIVDQAAHDEYQKLPSQEQEQLGYHYLLFQKLQELVRQCDRIVHRNKDKLANEIRRKLGQRGAQELVEEVDEGAVEQVAALMVQTEDLEKSYREQSQQLETLYRDEQEALAQLEPLLQAKKTQEETGKVDDETQSQLDELQKKVGQLLIDRQQCLARLADTIRQLAPMAERIDAQRRQLNYVRSDISTDKTVCEVSGNFMSSRDADERIAAHYQGKQFVGWKLVRDKHASMQREFGRHGPPPPPRRNEQRPPPRGGYHSYPPPHHRRGPPPRDWRR